MEKYLFTIEGDTPSLKNSKQIFKNSRTGRRFITASEAYKSWFERAYYLLMAQNRPKTPIPRAFVSVTLYYATRRKKDLINGTEGILDLLVKTKVLEDDNFTVIPKLEIEFGGLDKERPRAIVEVASL